MLNSVLAKIRLIKSSPIGTTCCIFPGFQFLVSNEEKKKFLTRNQGKSKEFSDLYFYIFHKKRHTCFPQKKPLKKLFYAGQFLLFLVYFPHEEFFII